MRIKWMWFNPEECEICGQDLSSQIEIERGICDNCYPESGWDEYLKCGVSPGDKDE